MNIDFITAHINNLCSLDAEEKEFISDVIRYHECEPSAAAERIAKMLDVEYSVIHDILFA